jgi:hypothetical protein
VFTSADRSWWCRPDHNGELKFHDVHTGKLEFEAVPQANAAIDALAVSADGKFLAVGLNSPKMLSPSVRIYPLELNDKEKQLGAAWFDFLCYDHG